MSNFSFPRTAGRAGLAATAAAFLALGLAAPAAADEVETYEGSVEGKYIDNAESGPKVYMTGGSAPTSLFNLELTDGSVLTTYCIDFQTNIIGGAEYKEDDWANYPGKGDFAEPGKVLWILQHGYPNVDAAALGEAAEIEGLSNKDALAGTQAAIWHFSNGMDLDLENDKNSDAVRAVYAYLTENAVKVEREPGAALSITPSEPATGEAGAVVGEFTVETNASDIPVVLDAPEGVQLVDIETGESVATVNDGDTVGFGVPSDAEDGQASFSLEASSSVETGRLFQGKDPEQPTQTLITVDGDETTVSASASASWTAGGETPPPTDKPSEPTDKPSEPTDKPSEPADKPSEPGDDKPTPPKDDEPTLPVTGGALAGLVAAGVAALGAGGGALYLSRKRKAATGEDADA
ncbi:thioester domain-containing protein [Nocardiopsis ganjiahuensis]|uniref:thioester domain-containing protein n=1 Tax=Nocardiopsis ganjiahuensis TaxID=239984 RepID=UPI00034A654B|nr:thioester domain-containing protein [Nocardiopsis ganjiahuensis]